MATEILENQAIHEQLGRKYAAGFVTDAKLNGAETVEINLERTDRSGLFDRHVLGPASEAVPRWVDEILAES